MKEGPLKGLAVALERTKTQIRSRVEHPFRVVKNLFGHRKVRYKGLAENTVQLCVQPVRAGELGDCEKSVIVDSWEQSVICVKMREMKLVSESNSPKSTLAHFVPENFASTRP